MSVTVLGDEDMKEFHEKRREKLPESKCFCGLHTIPARIDGIQWYWARHGRKDCLLELPDSICWCGLLRSEHQQDGHQKGQVLAEKIGKTSV